MLKRARVGGGLVVLGVVGMVRIATLPVGPHPWALPVMLATCALLVVGVRMVRSPE